jgi:hypothetical protein
MRYLAYALSIFVALWVFRQGSKGGGFAGFVAAVGAGFLTLSLSLYFLHQKGFLDVIPGGRVDQGAAAGMDISNKDLQVCVKAKELSMGDAAAQQWCRQNHLVGGVLPTEGKSILQSVVCPIPIIGSMFSFCAR